MNVLIFVAPAFRRHIKKRDEKMIFNETPVRTSKNFKINNISIEDLELPTDKKEFKNRNIYINTGKDVLLYGETIEDSTRLNDIYEDDKVFVSELNDNSFNLTYEINKEIDDSIKKLVNQPLKIVVKENCSNANVSIDFCFDDENDCLIDNIEIIAEKNSRIDLTINYIPKVMYDKFVSKKSNDNDTIIVGSVEDNNKYFHRGILKFKCMEESVVNVTVINLLNNYSCNILSVDNNSAENSNLNFNIIDFGGKISL
ncbi:MAG: hypothetical protein J6X03_01650, partial [Bacilli bacterium]|nr:hypothetical protein [Bacilli bacterium]